MISLMKGVPRKKRHTDTILNGCTYLSSAISILVLVSIFIFIFSKGFTSIGMKMLTGNYWAKNYLTSVQTKYNQPQAFKRPADLDKKIVFSSKWGVGFIDAINENKENIVLIEYIAKDSPFMYLKDDSIKNRFVGMEGEVGFIVEKLQFFDSSNRLKNTGNIMSHTSKEVVDNLDQKASKIKSIFFKTPGGGIRGSILATLYLILISLCIALPFSIAAAIYLQEYAKDTKITRMIRSAIEMLTGVPSIIFGLMGVSVLFPITQIFGATTTNILLGGLTMSIILLPIIIRSSEEALLVVPQSLRDASYSLGANQSQTIFKVVLPCAVPGILTGVLLSVGRIIGESAALIYVMGTFVNDSPKLLSQGTSLAVHIYNIMSSETPNFELASAISIVILVFVLILNIIVKIVSNHFNKAWY